jgi:hypothetical protein
MPMRNRRRYSRRGLSTVVTSMLLVTAVSIMGVGLVSWSNSSFATQQLNVANQAASRIDLIRESLVVEDVWFYNAGTKADITIRNTGDLAITINKIYVNNTQAYPGSQVITTGNTAKITIDMNPNWEPGNAQSIWVVTERGSEVKQIWKS